MTKNKNIQRTHSAKERSYKFRAKIFNFCCVKESRDAAVSRPTHLHYFIPPGFSSDYVNIETSFMITYANMQIMYVCETALNQITKILCN